jgi:hypothetical protein
MSEQKNAYMREWKRRNKEKLHRYARNYKAKNPDLYRRLNLESYHRNAERWYDQQLLNNARTRARKKGLPFDLVVEDLAVPDVCPALGIPLIKRVGRFHNNSPTLDRLIPELGYVKGNVRVVSYRANRIKYQASLEELEAVTAWLRRELER